MTDFRCISCGNIKESSKPGICPVCGYKMFAVPYDRSEVLKKEIKDFILHHIICDISDDEFEYYRLVPDEPKTDEDKTVYKSEDDKRFPDFKKIQDYVCSAKKTEEFYERLLYSIEQIREHIKQPYEQDYLVSLGKSISRIDLYDEVLKEALPAAGVIVELMELKMPKLKLHYSEIPDRELLSLAQELLDQLILLAEKYKKFIRQNNIYGTLFRSKPRNAYKPSAKKNDYAELKKCGEMIKKTLSKNYVVDIFSDGSEESGEMLKTLWGTIETIMSVPILTKKCLYSLDETIAVEKADVKRVIVDKISERYSSVTEAIFAFDFLSDKTEDELFAIYDRMIGLDRFEIMGVSKSGLLRTGENEKKLNEMIGLSAIKDSIKKIKAYALANKDRDDLNIHMCFLGNPGSGKTEVARLIAGILYENKILPTKKIVEVDRSGLVSQYFGATCEKTRRVISSAMGGVLFVDEAYALGNSADFGSTDYGKEAIDTLVKAMEDNRGKLCVILAGYKNEMLQMLSVNPGFKSRIQFTLDFQNYSRDELRSITELMLKKRKYTISEAAMERILDITDIKRKEANFANAREIRNIIDQVVMCQNMRTLGTDDKELGIIDVNQYIQDSKINLPLSDDGAKRKILTGEEELEKLIGLTSVKRMIKKIKAYAKRNKGEADFNLHMCFYGSPGTGKTEVARILSRILYDAGVLGEAKLVETDGQGLLGKAVGETAPKTEAKINEAINGVLFIDEAYTLTGGTISGASNYGDEAIAVLLKEMEDRRGQFCVILAGYKDEMNELLSANPGFRSRIQFNLEFPDYSREELSEIANVFLTKKKYMIEDTAFEKLLDVTEYYRRRPDFANARTVRNIIDQVIMNQNLRTEEDESPDNMILLSDVEDYIGDEGIDLASSYSGHRIGF